VVASTAQEPESGLFQRQSVGSQGYLQHHNSQMFREGRSFSGNERDKLWFNRGDATFADLSSVSGCDSPNDGRAAIAADFDDDGDLDLFVHQIQRERHALYRNELGQRSGGFLKVRLRGTRGQHEAIGATVVAGGPRGPVAQVLSRGAGFESCSPPELVFGLGGAREAEVSVRWPGGASESFGKVPAGSRVLLVEGAGKPETLSAQPRRLPDPLLAGLKLAVGDRLPAVSVLDTQGAPARLDAAALAQGRPIYLNLWSVTCAPCVAEIPTLQKLHASGEIRVLAVCVDPASQREKALELLRARGATFPCWFLGASSDPALPAPIEEALIDLSRLPLPTTLSLDADGRVVEVIGGALSD
jgi:thiol-disulfide isomerase/thioredoxin